MQHYHHRKRWIENRVKDAIEDGFLRLVILGAGFDTLSYRISGDVLNTEIIELDHPATQGAKLRALEQNKPTFFLEKQSDPALAKGSWPLLCFKCMEQALC